MIVKTPITVVAALLALLVALVCLAFGASSVLAAAPEIPQTEVPTAITGTTATLNGEPNPNVEAEVGYHFAYSTTATCTEGATTAFEPEAKLPAATKVTTNVTGLEGSTTYAVCLVASNPEGETTGTPQTFKTPASKPVVESQSVSGVTPLDAMLEGSVNPESQETTYHLEFATNSAFTTGVKTFAYGVAGPGTSSVQPLGPVDIGGGLTPNTIYYYRVVAKNPTGETKGTVGQPFGEFTTEALKAPSIDGESVTGVAQTRVELHAQINPEYQETEYQFKLGTSTAYGVDMPTSLTGFGVGEGFFGELGAGVNVQNELKAQALEALKPNIEYHYEVLAKNKTGTTEGFTVLGDQKFLTLPNPPSVGTGEASSITTHGATISGSVNPGSSGFPAQDDTQYSFQYGTTMSYGHQVPGLLDHAEAETCRVDHEKGEACPTESEAGEGEGAKAEQANLVDLEPGITYHYRIVATNDNANTEGGLPQTVYGQDETFTTPATPPVLSGVSVSGVTQSSATITATLDPQGLLTRYELQLGSTPGLLQAEAFGNTAGVLPLTLTVGSLSPGTLYYYKLIATSLNGTSEPEGTFTTALGPGASSPLTQPPTPPLLTTPAIAFPAETKTTTPKALTNAQKLAKALKACRKDVRHAKKEQCERKARAKYGPVRKKTARKK